MKQLLILLSSVILVSRANAQYVYTIKADSVKLTACDSTELIIENHTQGVPGFLFNTGNGRTIFKRAVMRLDDSTYVVGVDTLHTNRPSYWKANGTSIYNINPGNVGIGRNNPNVLLDLPGPVNIDDTSAYNLNYHPVLRIGGYVEADYFTNENLYANLFLGDSAGLSIGYPNYGTYVGNAAGQNDNGNFSTLFGYAAGMDNQGSNTAAFGFLSGQFSSPDDFGAAGANSFFGNYSGQGSSGAYNTFSGYSAGAYNTGNANSAIGYSTASQNRGNYNVALGYMAQNLNQGDSNVSVGTIAGYYNNGKNNVSIGSGAGSSNVGSNNILVGHSTGINNKGSGNTIIGSGTATDLNYTAARNGITLLGSNISLVTWHEGNIYHASSTPVTDATAIGANAIVKTSNTMVFGDSAVNSWLFNSGANAFSGAALVVGYNSTNGNGAYLTTGGVWTNASDRNKKENFQQISDNDILAKINQLPVTRWNYKGLSEQHIGPVAQDFHRIFQVGSDDKAISTIDPSGIALAGIQGLYHKWQYAEAKTEKQSAKIKDQQSEIDQLKSQLQQQENKMQQIMEKLNSLETAVNQKPTLKNDVAKTH